MEPSPQVLERCEVYFFLCVPLSMHPCDLHTQSYKAHGTREAALGYLLGLDPVLQVACLAVLGFAFMACHQTLAGFAKGLAAWTKLRRCLETPKVSGAAVLQAANVDATLTRLKKQKTLQEEKKKLAADAAAAAERAVREGQPVDPDFSPNGVSSAQFGNSEAEDRAAIAAHLANEISQVESCWYSHCLFHS